MQKQFTENNEYTTNISTQIYYLTVIARQRKMILRITLAALVFSIVISMTLTKKYRSTACILPPLQDNSMMGMMMGQMGAGMASLAGDLLGRGNSADLYASILRTEAFKDRIIDRFKLQDVYSSKYRLDVYKQLEKTVTIDVGKKDGIISIAVIDKDPKRAADIANAYIDELDKFVSVLNITDASNNRTFLEQRLAKTRTDMATAENALKLFQSKNKALDISEQAKGTIRGIADLEAQLAAEEVKLASIRRIFTDSSQEVKNQQAIVANVKGQVTKFEGSRAGTVVLGVGNLPSIGLEYMRLMREFKIQESLLELLTKQYELTNLTVSKNSINIQVIQKATVPDKKFKPKRSLLVLISTFIAFVFSIIITLIIDIVDRMPITQRKCWKDLWRLLIFDNVAN